LYYFYYFIDKNFKFYFMDFVNLFTKLKYKKFFYTNFNFKLYKFNENRIIFQVVINF